jgi:AraC-like DNA-binding protein
MRLLKTELTPWMDDLMKIDFRNQPFLLSPFHPQPKLHSHPELELVFVIDGFGKRIIGNNVEAFESGDMVLVGSGLPHLWISDQVYYEKNSNRQASVIVAYFNPKVFMQIFESIKEFESIRDMIRQSARGIRIFGETRKIIADRLIELSQAEGFQKVDGLLQIMNIITVSSEKDYIVNECPNDDERLYSDRLVNVFKYVKENINQHISLRQVADIACMTEQSFCRFFKKRVKKNFSQFVSELRIDHAKELLLYTDRSVSDIAYLCGFKSSSHFCCVFKELSGESAMRYKSSAKTKFECA